MLLDIAACWTQDFPSFVLIGFGFFLYAWALAPLAWSAAIENKVLGNARHDFWPT